MVFIKYHKQKLKTKGKGTLKTIRSSELRKLEKMLTDLGWTDLRWCPCDPRDKEHRYVLIGGPPNYDGEYSDYTEEAIYILPEPNRPDADADSGEVLVRDYLDGPVFQGPEGIAFE